MGQWTTLVIALPIEAAKLLDYAIHRDAMHHCSWEAGKRAHPTREGVYIIEYDTGCDYEVERELAAIADFLELEPFVIEQRAVDSPVDLLLGT